MAAFCSVAFSIELIAALSWEIAEACASFIEQTPSWFADDNDVHPHHALRYQPPASSSREPARPYQAFGGNNKAAGGRSVNAGYSRNSFALAEPYRPLIFGALVVAHILVIGWLMKSPEPLVVKKPMVFQVTALGNLPGSKSPTPEPSDGHMSRDLAPPANVHKAAPITLPSVSAIAATAANSAEAAVVGSGCSIAGKVGDAITHDPAALAQLAALPPEMRSVANAVFIWNGEWLIHSGASPVVTSAAPAAIDSPLQRTIESAVASAATECRAAPMTGPAFIAVQEGTRTTMLVVGSGIWRWDQVMTSECEAPTNPCVDVDNMDNKTAPY